ncbi:MAG: metallophosphoesterase [Lachnospiraceae bacterium]|nr:metallophosphoesterase [Lachnospiraceae bacterium]
MKILIVSDNHRYVDDFKKVVEKVAKFDPLDLVIHCGDSEGTEEAIGRIAGCPLEIVTGNNDYFSALPREKEFMVGRYKVWLVHGHKYFVAVENKTIRDEAIRRNADIVMYGHTHRPVVDIKPDLIVINPGSLRYPRQEGRRRSFIIMDIDGNGEAHFTINYL